MAAISRIVELDQETIETIEVFDLCGTNRISGLDQSGGDFTNITWLKNGVPEAKTISIEEVAGAPGLYNVKFTPAGADGDIFYLTFYIPTIEEWHSFLFYTGSFGGECDLSAVLAELYRMQSKNGGGFDRTTDSLEAIRDAIDNLKLTVDADLGLKIDTHHKLKVVSDEDTLKMRLASDSSVIKLTVIEDEEC